jgi:hypothetical protein
MAKKIIYYEAEEEVQRHRTKQLTRVMELEQADLPGIQAEQLLPTLTQSIYSRASPKQQTVYIKPEDYPANQQKKILQYMCRNHNDTFTFLNQQVSSLCQTLNDSALHS